MRLSGKQVKRLSLGALGIFSMMNLIAYFHAYKFTHFDSDAQEKTKDAQKLSTAQKLKTIFLGIENPRPSSTIFPKKQYSTIKLKSNKEIECWLTQAAANKGTIVLFHGYSGSKSKMLQKAEVFDSLGYNVMMVDFMGSGGSAGNQTTIGFYEAEEVKTCFNYVAESGAQNIILFGTSMGAVAIMKAVKDYNIKPAALILECPFGTMLETVQARFKSMNIPGFPMANLLVFWGGFQNDFNAFKHNPSEDAKSIQIPTLLLYGEKDDKVSRAETDTIFNHLKGSKTLKTYPLSGHEDYCLLYKEKWIDDINSFLEAQSEMKL